ncbi:MULTISPECIES: lipid asymmetry maintenance protein MlaB [Tatumella]|uniref:Lipid asymmetry maintenance protein MlaB n=1 Tax=Tatumella punctata TaxID=399969 RepID=A0ABW1VJD1_9GAMM|nr:MULTISPECIES: lipid asymmetry maintenance protein MlaB [unclassified Tatumella]MBS0856430.1 lipid asymmetry maintenance protein MlaB [Tatumella sp. JGM16]MBS0877352.1 lipid asymmetry maintenance protein MlaB [Tatumella sp. JGM82]MBS0890775.1 lipid asymmetry maintenance protein MlaB [Tatumella sp. JGM94]MBS0893439.1 lipid asymmetry maintenance protein MlaB [Tatumella sp. JGM130]MBS0901749.1 lipid asymmetry maintenance protein MlaB [Tatumella sp. JGM100]
MNAELHWQQQAASLRLTGKLDHETLLPLWEQRDTVMQGISDIDLSGLERVDSSGLALLIHLQDIVRRHGAVLTFTGISDKLQSLITLYNLQHIIVSSQETP